MKRLPLVLVAACVAFAAMTLTSALGAGTAQPGKLAFEDRIAPHATTSVTIVVHRAASFSVRFRVWPTNGRTRVYLTGATAPKGGPLLDTKGVGCDGAAGSWVCEGSYEPLPPGTYTFRIRHDASVVGHVELTVLW
jgi:hypothetical protein